MDYEGDKRTVLLFKRLSGQRWGPDHPAGLVEIPFLGAKVAAMDSWSLTRRGDIGPEAGLYDLRAEFSFVAEALWNDPDYQKVITLNFRRTPPQQFRVEQQPGYRTVFSGKTLLMEGVLACPLDPPRP